MDPIHCQQGQQVRVDYRHVRFVVLNVIPTQILIGLDNGQTLCCTCAEGVDTKVAFAEVVTAWEQANAVKCEPAETYLHAPPNRNGWEPIYTAPRDGQEILAWGRDWRRLHFVSWQGEPLSQWADREGIRADPRYWLPAASRPPFIRDDF